MGSSLDFPGGLDGKASAYNVGDQGSIPGLGRSPREGNGNPLQYSCLENPMDREAQQASRLQSMRLQRVGQDFTFTLARGMLPVRQYKDKPLHQSFREQPDRPNSLRTILHILRHQQSVLGMPAFIFTATINLGVRQQAGNLKCHRALLSQTAASFFTKSFLGCLSFY